MDVNKDKNNLNPGKTKQLIFLREKVIKPFVFPRNAVGPTRSFTKVVSPL